MKVTCPSCDRPYRERNFAPGAARKCPNCEDVIYLPMDPVPEAYLVPLEGEMAGKRIALSARMIIGRAHDCEIHVLDNTLSRQHAELCVDGPDFVISDMDSRNSVFVNDVAVSDVKLAHLDIIRMGNRRFRYEMGQTARPAAWTPEAKTRLGTEEVGVAEESSNTIRISAADSAKLLAGLFPGSPSGGISTVDARIPTMAMPAGGIETDAPSVAKPRPAVPKSLLKVSDAFLAPPPLGPTGKSYACIREIYRLHEALEAGGNEDAAISTVLDHVRGAVGADRVAFIRKDEKDTAYKVRVTRTLGQALSKDELQLDQKVAERVVTEKIVLIADEARQTMFAPLVSALGGAELVAVDRMRSRTPFENEDLELLAAVARQAAVTLDNFRLATITMDPGSSSAPVARPRLAAQVSEVTELAVDLYGLVRSPGENATPVLELANQVHGLIARALANNGGTLDRRSPESIRAYWSSPSANKDDALRAARAAFEIQKELAQLNGLRAGRQAVQAAIGLHTGESVTGSVGPDADHVPMALGDVGGIAARLSARARPGETLVTRPVQAMLAGVAKTHELPHFDLPARAGALDVHLLDSLN